MPIKISLIYAGTWFATHHTTGAAGRTTFISKGTNYVAEINYYLIDTGVAWHNYYIPDPMDTASIFEKTYP